MITLTNVFVWTDLWWWSCYPVNTECQVEAWTAWSKCADCHGSTITRTRKLSPTNQALPETCVQQLVETKICGFPCGISCWILLLSLFSVDDTVTNKLSILQYLYDSFRDFNWLQEQAISPVVLIITKSEKCIWTSWYYVNILAVQISIGQVVKRSLQQRSCSTDPIIISLADTAMNVTSNLPR